MEERETNERKSEGLHRRLNELFTSLSVTLGGDYGQGDAAAFDKLISRVRYSSHLHSSSSFQLDCRYQCRKYFIKRSNV